MCGRIHVNLGWELLQELYDLDDPDGVGPAARYNLAPTQQVIVVRERPGDEGRELAAMRWGLVPHWAKDPKIAYSTFNARGETVAAKPAFRAAFKRRRCVVPVSGFYEWKREGSVKQPFCFWRGDGAPMSLAGLWERWQGPDGEPLLSCTVVTTAANGDMAGIHDRMPVVLEPGDLGTWLDQGLEDRGVLEELVRPGPEGRLIHHAVSRHVNNARHDDPSCVEPLDEPLDEPGTPGGA